MVTTTGLVYFVFIGKKSSYQSLNGNETSQKRLTLVFLNDLIDEKCFHENQNE